VIRHFLSNPLGVVEVSLSSTGYPAILDGLSGAIQQFFAAIGFEFSVEKVESL
jgi:hypothetical protein